MAEKYKITLESQPIKFLKKQPRQIQERLLRAIYQLPSGNVIPLKGADNTYRLRVGNFRIIYMQNKNELQILILRLGNRGDVYKKI